jgi:hypothetical protein
MPMVVGIAYSTIIAFFPVPVAAGACCCNGCQSHDCESDKKLIYGWCSRPNM